MGFSGKSTEVGCHCLLWSPVWPLPICLDSWTWHSRFLCNIALYSIGPCFHHQLHSQLGVVFALAPSSFFLELFLHSSPVAYWAPTLLGSSSFSVLSFAFSYCSSGSQGKNTDVVCHSLLQCVLGLFSKNLSKTKVFYCWVSPGAHMEERKLEKKTVNHVIKPLPILDK